MKTLVLVLALVAASLATTLVVEHASLYFGHEAAAQTAGSGSATPTQAAVVDAGVAAPDATAVVAPAPSAPAADQPKLAASDADVSLIVKLWRSGALGGAAIVALYLLLTLALKIDAKHAFYISAILTAIGASVEGAVNGVTPTASMLITAVVTAIGIIARGPTLAGAQSK